MVFYDIRIISASLSAIKGVNQGIQTKPRFYTQGCKVGCFCIIYDESFLDSEKMKQAKE